MSVRRSSTVAAFAAVLSLCCFASCSAQAQKKKAAAPDAAAEKSVPSYYGPQPATEDIDLNMYARIRAEGLEHGKVMQFGDALANGIGPRLTGSPNMAKANAWTRDTLAAIGLSNAHLEDWGEFGMGWQQINTWARMVSPEPEPLWMQAAPWSPATKGPVSGELVYVDLANADLDKLKGKMGGKSVLVGAMGPTPDIPEPLFHRYTDEELKEMESAPDAGGRRGAPAINIQQLIAERTRLAALRTQALKM